MTAPAAIAEFADARLVAVYETINAYEPGTQPAFYESLAAEVGATSVLDVGCGTGLITRALAHRGYRLTGIDPAPAMLDIARVRPHGDQVRWICGPVTELPPLGADFAFMSGHVAQFFVSDASWHDALDAIHRALRPGGWLAFESRNPEAREWEQWSRAAALRVDDPAAGSVETWTEVSDVANGIVAVTNHYEFATTGAHLASSAQLRFRTVDELVGSLADAGFAVERMYGDWDRRPPGPATRELIVVATRAARDPEPASLRHA